MIQRIDIKLFTKLIKCVHLSRIFVRRPDTLVKVHYLRMIQVIPRRGYRPFQVHPSDAYHRKRW